MKKPIYNPLAMGNPEFAAKYNKRMKKWEKAQSKQPIKSNYCATHLHNNCRVFATLKESGCFCECHDYERQEQTK